MYGDGARQGGENFEPGTTPHNAYEVQKTREKHRGESERERERAWPSAQSCKRMSCSSCVDTKHKKSSVRKRLTANDGRRLVNSNSM